MEEWGNARANEFFEANLSSKVQRPKEGDTVRTVEKFIRDKYEYKRYIGGAIPPKRTAEPEDHSSHRSQKPVDSHHASHHATAAPAPTPAPAPAIAPVVKAAPATDSLIDFLDDPIPAPVSFAPPAEPNNHSHIEFGDFSVASAAPAQQPPQTVVHRAASFVLISHSLTHHSLYFRIFSLTVAPLLKLHPQPLRLHTRWHSFRREGPLLPPPMRRSVHKPLRTPYYPSTTQVEAPVGSAAWASQARSRCMLTKATDSRSSRRTDSPLRSRVIQCILVAATRNSSSSSSSRQCPCPCMPLTVAVCRLL